MLEDLKKRKLAAIILAAGKGTRMRSDLAKVLHYICGKPMLFYPLELARNAGSEIIVTVVGHQSDVIRKRVKDKDIVFVEQKEQLGTGHAVLQTRDALKGFDGDILILCGDVPLLLPSTIEALIGCHLTNNATVTVMTTRLDYPTGYGRIVKGRGDSILKIVEERDATDEERRIKEINSGIYCVEGRFLLDAVVAIGNENAQGEYYLTDIVEIAVKKKYKVISFVVDDSLEVMGINTIEDLERADRVMEKRRNKNFLVKE